MITIKVSEQEKWLTKIVISGHANFKEFGQDIVCASVSSIVITSVNAILSIENDSIKYIEDEGFVQIDVIKKELIVNKLIINMIDLLKQLEKKYPKNVKFIK